MYGLRFRKLISLILMLSVISLLNLKTVTATGSPLLLLDYREIDEKHFMIDTYICDVESMSIIALPIAFNPDSVKVCGYNGDTGEFSQVSDGALSAEQISSGKCGISFAEKALDSKYWGGSLIYNEMYPYISNSKGYIHFAAYSLNSEFGFEGNNLFYSICFERISDAMPEIRIASESNTENFDIASPTGATLMNLNGIIDVAYELRGEIFTEDAPINPEEPEDLFGETEYSGGVSLSGGMVNNESEQASDNKTETKKIVFSDVDKNFWAYEYIYKLAENKIINGYGDNTFKPNGNITRAELTKIAVTAKNLSLLEKRDQFSDSPVTAWHNPYLITAFDAGIISGYPDGSFGPEKNITREDLCVVLANAFFKDIESDTNLIFEDTADISGYALSSVKKIYDKGIVQGRGGNMFAPKENATRAEAAKIVYMCLDAMN